jgi:hypothetical protein
MAVGTLTARAGARLRAVDPILAGCLALALGLRLWGIAYGLPHVYNPDEVSIMSRALGLARGGMNPHNFVYPNLFFYVLAAAVGVAYLTTGLTRGRSLAEFEAAFWNDPTPVYLAGRLVSTIAGVLTVAVVYALGRKIGGRTMARAAAALMAVAYLPVRDAHMVKHDVTVTLVIALVVLACWRVWEIGRRRDYAAAGALAGVAFAIHYYAALAVVPVAVAHALRVRSAARFVADRGAWIAAGVFAATFACLSPFVLIDWPTALRDIAANREIVIGRALATYGMFGTADEHLDLLVMQSAGGAMLAVGIAGAAWFAAARPAAAVLLLSFPSVFFLFLANAWPFGRLANPLFPFIALAAAYAIHRLAQSERAGTIKAVALTALCAIQPLTTDVIMNRLMSREDTRTAARRWIEANVPHGAGVAIQPYSVPLAPTRERLREALERHGGDVRRAGYRARTLLERTPYPQPAYRLYYLGTGGMDEDKFYFDPDDLARPGRLEALIRDGLRFVVLKRFAVPEDSLFRRRLEISARLVHVEWPFSEGVIVGTAQLPDYDIRPSFDVARPGPVVEVWSVEPR